LVYGDYDIDGIAATVILGEVLEQIGCLFIPFVPHREQDGYGVRAAAVSRWAGGVKLVVTVDNGAAAVGELKKLRKAGKEVIVLDHHPPRETEIEGIWQINPLLLPPPQRMTIPAAAVAWQVAKALMEHRGEGEQVKWSLDMVCLAALGDALPLQGINRALVKYGLRVLQCGQRQGLRLLCEKMGLAARLLSVRDLIFRIIPSLNAAGRMSSATLALRLLLSREESEAARLAEEVVRLNAERRRLSDYWWRELAGRVGTGDKVCVAVAPLPPGLTGLLAARLAEYYRKPAFVLARGAEETVGSARGMGVVRVNEVLTKLKTFLRRGGGHANAAGFTLSNNKIAAFVDALKELAQQWPAPPPPALTLEAWLREEESMEKLLSDLIKFEPFGPGNPPPLFLVSPVKLVSVQAHSSGKHYFLRWRREKREEEGVWFDAADAAAALRSGQRLALAVTAESAPRQSHSLYAPRFKILDVHTDVA
jgi:single-stranded-DNA-specific exonuclease